MDAGDRRRARARPPGCQARGGQGRDRGPHPHILTISDQHQESKEEEEEEQEDKHCVQRERRYGSFSRSMALAAGVVPKKIEAPGWRPARPAWAGSRAPTPARAQSWPGSQRGDPRCDAARARPSRASGPNAARSPASTPTRPAQRDLFPLRERQVVALRVPPSPWAHPACLRHPTRARICDTSRPPKQRH